MSTIEILFLVFGIIVFISVFLLMYAPSTLESKKTEVVVDKNLSEQTTAFIINSANPLKQMVNMFFLGVGLAILYPIILIISEYSQPIRYILISLFYIAPFFAMWYKEKYNNNGFIAIIISTFFIFGFIHLSKININKESPLIEETTSKNTHIPENDSEKPSSQVFSATDLAKQATGQSKDNELKSTDDLVNENNIKHQNTTEMELIKSGFGEMSLDEQIKYLGEQRMPAKKELTEVDSKNTPCTNAICEATKRLQSEE